MLRSGAEARKLVWLQVYRGILNNSVPVAIKELADEESQAAKKSFVEEIVCLMNLRHTNVSPWQS